MGYICKQTLEIFSDVPDELLNCVEFSFIYVDDFVANIAKVFMKKGYSVVAAYSGDLYDSIYSNEFETKEEMAVYAGLNEKMEVTQEPSTYVTPICMSSRLKNNKVTWVLYSAYRSAEMRILIEGSYDFSEYTNGTSVTSEIVSYSISDMTEDEKELYSLYGSLETDVVSATEITVPINGKNWVDRLESITKGIAELSKVVESVPSLNEVL